MMIVVPAVSEYGNRQNKIVPAIVVAAVRASSEQVAERIYAPDRMVPESDANQPTPQKSVEGAVQPANQPTT